MVQMLNPGVIIGKQVKCSIGSLFAEIDLTDTGSHMLHAGLLQEMDIIFGLRMTESVFQNLQADLIFSWQSIFKFLGQ